MLFRTGDPLKPATIPKAPPEIYSPFCVIFSSTLSHSSNAVIMLIPSHVWASSEVREGGKCSPANRMARCAAVISQRLRLLFGSALQESIRLNV